MIYVTDGKTEHIEGDGYRSDDYPLYTLFLRFFDMIIDRQSDDTVYFYLTGLQNEEVSYEEACEYLPLFRLVNRQSEYYQIELIELFEFYENGREVLADIFREQRENEETLFKTLYIRSMDESKRKDDYVFLKQIDLRNVREPAETIWEFFILCFNKLATGNRKNGTATVYIGQCERCFSHYPIRRVQHGALEKNRFCENCRNSMAAMLTKESKKNTPLYSEYQKLYNRYYQQFKRLNNITYQQFKDIILIAGNVREDFLKKGITDTEKYQEEVEKQVREWKSNG